METNQVGEPVSPCDLLIVDDDADVREALASVLEDEGYKVLIAESGRAALETLRRGARPTLILLDLMMPVMDGYEFRARQLQDPDLAKIPVVVLTAGAMDPRVEALGAVRSFRKPVSLERLLEALRAITSGKPAR
jgi:CheY-like chemotaxis protein